MCMDMKAPMQEEEEEFDDEVLLYVIDGNGEVAFELVEVRFWRDCCHGVERVVVLLEEDVVLE